jgi:hypothetical protein
MRLAIASLLVANFGLTAAWSCPMISSTRKYDLSYSSAIRKLPNRPVNLRMGFLGFDFGELKNLGNLIIKCEGE